MYALCKMCDLPFFLHVELFSLLPAPVESNHETNIQIWKLIGSTVRWLKMMDKTKFQKWQKMGCFWNSEKMSRSRLRVA